MNESRMCCGIWIDFAWPEGDGPAMPVERRSADQPGGNLAVSRIPGGGLRYRVLRDGEEPGPGEHRAVSHFANCDQAGRWRRARVCRR